MAFRKKIRGHTTPKGTRPAHLRAVESAPTEASIMDSIIDTGARDVLDEDDPMAAEAWASDLLGMFDATRERAAADGMAAPPFEGAILERCSHRNDAGAAVVATAFAAVLGPPLDAVGRVRPTRA